MSYSSGTRLSLDAPRRHREPARIWLLMFFALHTWIASAQSTATEDWSRAAISDLHGIHDALRDNHPGPYNPNDPGFSDWLEHGLQKLLPQAEAAHDVFGYQRVLRSYANGFSDYHLGVWFKSPLPNVWPGFLTRTDSLGAATRVVIATEAPYARVGDIVERCGNATAQELLPERVLIPRANAEAPQQLRLTSPWLMMVDAGDLRSQSPSCQFRRGSLVYTHRLTWRTIDSKEAATLVESVSGIQTPHLGLRRSGDDWILSLPSFSFSGPSIEQMQHMIATLKDQAAALHAARHFVIDLRGNGGGDSGWGMSVIDALWGEPTASNILASFDQTVAWRASPHNRDKVLAGVPHLNAVGHTLDARAFAKAADDMTNALEHGTPLVQEDDPATSQPPKLVSPFAHTVYLVTDPHCASACLDFLDLTTRLPGVVRVGFRTGADKVYTEIGSVPLPSGNASLGFGMKFYVHRLRGSNTAYEPSIPWPGGDMTDETLSAWIGRLP